MNDKQIDALILKNLGSGTMDNLRAMVRAAMAAEREACNAACAQVLQEYAEQAISAGDLNKTNTERAGVGVCMQRIALRSNV